MATDNNERDDISDLLVPKSNTLGGDHLLGGPVICRIVSTKRTGDPKRKIELRLVTDRGENLLPWLPCLTMTRLMSAAWGTDRIAWVGRWLHLYRDPDVTYGGNATGGVRIRAMSHIEARMKVVLTASDKVKAPIIVDKLTPPTTGAAQSSDPLAGFRAHLERLALPVADVIAWIREVDDGALDDAARRKSWISDLTDPNGQARQAFAAWSANRTAAPST